MARIPVFTSRVRAPGATPGAIQVAGAPARAVAGFAGMVADISAQRLAVQRAQQARLDEVSNQLFIAEREAEMAAEKTRIQLEAKDAEDPEGLTENGLARFDAFAEDLLSGVADPVLRQRLATSSISKVRSPLESLLLETENTRRTDSANTRLDEVLSGLTADIFRNPSSHPATVQFGINAIDEFVASAGLPPARADSRKAEFRKSAAVNMIRAMTERNPFAMKDRIDAGEFDDLLQDDITQIEKLSDEAESAIDALLTDLEASESREDKAVKAAQTAMATDLLVGVLDGEVTELQLRDSLASRSITGAQFTKLQRALRTDDTAQDDPDIMLGLTLDVLAGRPDMRNRVVDARTAGSITTDTAKTLLGKIDEVERRGGILARDDVQRARRVVDDNVGGIRGPMAILDTDASIRTSAALREFDERVLAGGSPFEVADDVVKRYRLAQPGPTSFPMPLFLVGPRASPDIAATRSRTLEALANGEIGRDEAADELRNLEEIDKAMNPGTIP